MLQSRGESSNAAMKVVPEGRRIVRVVMLNGRQIPFVIEVCKATSGVPKPCNTEGLSRPIFT